MAKYLQIEKKIVTLPPITKGGDIANYHHDRSNTTLTNHKNQRTMYWTLELASKLEDAPWPATKEELLDYANRSGISAEVIENLEELEDEGEPYDSIEDIWPDYPTKDDFLFDEEEY